MPNRVIKESICNSKSLAKCSHKAQDQFHKFLLFADDWGCFKVDYQKMKDTLFSLRKDINLNKIEQFLREYYDQGMLFFWGNKIKVYGFFVNWDQHTGEYLSRRGKRKTPEPPPNLLQKYIDSLNLLQVTSNGFSLLQNRSVDSGIRIESELESELELEKKKDLKPSCSENRQPEFSERAGKLKSRISERAGKLKSLILANNPKANITDSQVKNWANDVRLMVERDKRTLMEIDQLIEFSQNDSFWKVNVLSMGKLREKFDQLTMKMKGRKSGASKKVDPSSADKFTKTGFSEIPEPKT